MQHKITKNLYWLSKKMLALFLAFLFLLIPLIETGIPANAEEISNENEVISENISDETILPIPEEKSPMDAPETSDKPQESETPEQGNNHETTAPEESSKPEQPEKQEPVDTPEMPHREGNSVISASGEELYKISQTYIGKSFAIKLQDVNGNFIAGAEFAIKDINGNVVDKWTTAIPDPDTNKSDTAAIHTVALEEGKEYFLVQTKAVNGCALAADCELVVDVNADENVAVNIVNKTISACVIDQNGIAVPDVHAIVFDNKNIEICQWQSLNENNIIPNLKTGNEYILSIVDSPADYSVSSKTFMVKDDTKDQVEIINAQFTANAETPEKPEEPEEEIIPPSEGDPIQPPNEESNNTDNSEKVKNSEESEENIIAIMKPDGTPLESWVTADGKPYVPKKYMCYPNENPEVIDAGTQPIKKEKSPFSLKNIFKKNSRAAGDKLATFFWQGNPYNLIAGQSGSAPGASWTCDVNGNFNFEFTSSGTFTLREGIFDNTNVSLIGGGAGGEAAKLIPGVTGKGGNGGGAGQRVNQSVQVVEDQSVTITVGQGGSGGRNSGRGPFYANDYYNGIGHTSAGAGGDTVWSSSSNTVRASGGQVSGGGAGGEGDVASGYSSSNGGGGGGSVAIYFETDSGNFRGYGVGDTAPNFSCHICGRNTIPDWAYGVGGWTQLGQHASNHKYVTGGSGSSGCGNGARPGNSECGSCPLSDGGNGSDTTGGGGGGGAVGPGIYATGYDGYSRSRPWNFYCTYGGRGGSGKVTLTGKASEMNVGYLQIHKVSEFQDIIDKAPDPSIYSLKGTEFTVFYEELFFDETGQCIVKTTEMGKLTIGSHGYSGTITLPVANGYYFKETKTPIGYQPPPADQKIYFDINKDVATIPTVKNTPYLGTLTILKSSSRPDITDNDPFFTLENAKYGVFTSPNCTGEPFTVLTTDKTGKAPNNSTIVRLPIGVYYLKEIQAPNGYQLNPEIIRFNVTKTRLDQTIDVQDEPVLLGSLKLIKSSTCPNITDNNSNYSLAGAKYGVYKGNTLIKTLVTDAQGVATANNLPIGEYQVKEITAPTGFKLSTKVEKISIKNKITTTVNVTDEPLNDPVSIEIYKVDAEGKKVPGTRLDGAEFTINYYDGFYDKNTLPEQPTRHWIITTKYSEKLQTNIAWLQPEFFVSGDEFYREQFGKIIMPLGTIAIYESKAPDGYKIGDGNFKPEGIDTDLSGVYVAQITSDNSTAGAGLQGGHKYTMNEYVTKVSFDKLDEKGQPLSGAKLRVEDMNGKIVIPEWITDGTPHLVEGKLMSGDTYKLVEVAAPNGYTTADPVIFTVDPMMEGIQKVIMTDALTKVMFNKVDVNNNKISGAELELYDSNGKLIDSWISSNAAKKMEGKYIGQSFVLHEKTAPLGYAIAKDVNFTIEDVKSQSVTMKDKQVSVIVKTENGTVLETLTGVDLSLVDSSQSTHSWTSTTTAETINNLKVGEEYTVTISKVPDGYVIPDDYTFTVKDDGLNQLEVIIVKPTTVAISKVDGTGKPLSGAKLRIVDENGNVVVPEWVSSDKPYEISKLTVNKVYYLEEISAPFGYAKASKIKFIPKNDANVQTIVMKDIKIAAVITSDRQLDNFNVKTEHIDVYKDWAHTSKFAFEGNPYPDAKFSFAIDTPFPAGTELTLGDFTGFPVFYHYTCDGTETSIAFSDFDRMGKPNEKPKTPGATTTNQYLLAADFSRIDAPVIDNNKITLCFTENAVTERLASVTYSLTIPPTAKITAHDNIVDVVHWDGDFRLAGQKLYLTAEIFKDGKAICVPHTVTGSLSGVRGGWITGNEITFEYQPDATVAQGASSHTLTLDGMYAGDYDINWYLTAAKTEPSVYQKQLAWTDNGHYHVNDKTRPYLKSTVLDIDGQTFANNRVMKQGVEHVIHFDINTDQNLYTMHPGKQGTALAIYLPEKNIVCTVDSNTHCTAVFPATLSAGTYRIRFSIDNNSRNDDCYQTFIIR